MSDLLPSILRVRADGTLFCADGQDVKTYLADWAKKASVTEDTPINIMRRDQHIRDREDAFLLRNYGA
jgi:hypothetical protein